MPMRPSRPCSQPGCPNNAVKGGRCVQHQRADRDERPSAAQRGYGHAWQKLRKQFLKGNSYCVVCGDLATDVDHIVARVKGGTDDWDNLQPLCHAHHSEKTAKYDNKWGRS